jgi:hypothetical protein
MKVKEEAFSASSFEEKGLKAQGTRLASKPSVSAQLGVSKLAAKAARAAEASELFPETGSGRKPKAKAKAKAKASAKNDKPRLTRATNVPKKPSSAAPKSGLRARAEAVAAKEKAAAKKSRGPKPKKPAGRATKKR